MHFVSEDAGQVLVRAHKDVFSPASGEKVGVQPSIWLELERGHAPEWAAAEAEQAFKWEKRPRPGSIGGADIPVSRWCVYVDTEAWAEMNGHDDEIREKAEQLLLAKAGMLRVYPPKLRPPWPNYDELVVAGSRTAEKVAARNLETAEEIGVALGDLIYYEEMTHKREEVLAAYRAALAAREAQQDRPPAAVVVEA